MTPATGNPAGLLKSKSMKTQIISGYTVRTLHLDAPKYRDTMSESAFDVTTPKGKAYRVNLTGKPGRGFHAFEMFNDDADNLGNGYYQEGGLSISENILEDYDGGVFLPKCVCAVLRSTGVRVSDDCLSSPLELVAGSPAPTV